MRKVVLDILIELVLLFLYKFRLSVGSNLEKGFRGTYMYVYGNCSESNLNLIVCLSGFK